MRQGYAVCPTLDLLHLLGKKWTIPVLQELYYSRAMLSFNYLGNTISGATQRNLSLSLKELQDAGLIRKTESVIGRAKHTGYAITERGRALINVINAVKQLGVSWYGMDPRCKNFNCASCEFFAADRCVVRPTQQTDSIVVQLRNLPLSRHPTRQIRSL